MGNLSEDFIAFEGATLEEAYKAYANVVKNDYPKYKDTLPQ